MDAHLPQLARCVNDLELDFALLCERYSLPIPDPNERIARFRPDMLRSKARLIVELDGEDARSTPAQLEADERRQAELVRLGFTVLRVTWNEVHSSPGWVAAEVRRPTRPPEDENHLALLQLASGLIAFTKAPAAATIAHPG